MLKESELARREVGGIVLREGALRVRWEFEDLIASDGHRVNGSFGCMIQALPQPVERKMLEETFLARSASVLTEDIAAHFQPKLEEAARRLIETMTAEAVLSPEGKDAWTKKLAEACNRAAFSCGVSALPPMDAELDSPTVRLEHEEQRRDAQQTERMARAAGLFKQFQEIRASAPELTPGQVLQRIGAADQAEMLRSLLVASGKSSDKQALWAVAGPYLIKISAGALD